MSAKKDASRRNIAAIARELAPRAMEVLAGLLNSDDERVKLSAAEHIIDRAIGKPIAMSADVTDRLDEFTDDELEAIAADLRRKIADSVEVGGEQDTTPPVTH